MLSDTRRANRRLGAWLSLLMSASVAAGLMVMTAPPARADVDVQFYVPGFGWRFSDSPDYVYYVRHHPHWHARRHRHFRRDYDRSDRYDRRDRGDRGYHHDRR